jgi:hypothetical protein
MAQNMLDGNQTERQDGPRPDNKMEPTQKLIFMVVGSCGFSFIAFADFFLPTAAISSIIFHGFVTKQVHYS